MKNSKTKGWVLAIALFAAATAGGAQEAQDPKVTGLNFRQDSGRLEIDFDQDVSFEKTVSAENKQIILEIPSAKIPVKFARKLDTSSSKSMSNLISPYQNGNTVRVVMQLKGDADVSIEKETVGTGVRLVAQIPNEAGTATEPAPEVAAETAAAPEAAAETAPEAVPETAAAQEQTYPDQASETKAADALDNFEKSQNTKKYFGRRINLSMREADLKDVFSIISDASEFNIVLADEVKGKLTVNLNDVPWDQALDVILKTNKLAAERNGNILRVTTMENLTREKEAEVAAQRAQEAAEPIVVKIFPVSYAKLDDLRRILESFLSKEGGISGAARRGSIDLDSRTNSLVVRDTATTMEKIKRIITELDAQTPQILIEAKFVEVQEGQSKAVSGRIFGTTREFDAASNQFVFRGSNNNFASLFGGSTFSSVGNGFAITPVAGAAFGFAPKASLIPGLGEIGAFVSILETEENAKILASPRVVTQNKEQAEISQGVNITIPTVPGANASGGFTTVSAVLKLNATPQVTNDGTINMKLTFSQDALGASQLGTGTVQTNSKKIDTTVLVDSGATLVIGGIYSSSENNSASGIPFLRDLPIIGALFGDRSKTVTKTELFIFLTPRIINEKESGLKG